MFGLGKMEKYNNQEIFIDKTPSYAELDNYLKNLTFLPCTAQPIIEEKIFPASFKIPETAHRDICLVRKNNKNSLDLQNFRILSIAQNHSDSYINKKYMASLFINRNIQLYGYVSLYRYKVYELYQKTMKGKGTLVIADIKNAFNSVCLNTMEKMINCENLKKYFRKMYFKSDVFYKKQKIEWKRGLHQGSSISPALFMVYMDYVFNSVKKYATRIFAYLDDMVFYFENGCENMELIEKEFNNYGLEFNTAKTKYINSEYTEKLSYMGLNFTAVHAVAEFTELSEFIDNLEKLNYIINKIPLLFEDILNTLFEFHKKIKSTKALRYNTFAKEFKQNILDHEDDSIMELYFTK